MTDAVSTIKLGIETGSGKEDLVSLRQEFTKLREEVTALNSLKANAQGLVGGTQTAQSELATLGAELKASVTRVSELEQQLAKLGKAQASNAQAATAAVSTESKKQFDIQVTTAKNVAAEVEAAAKKATKSVQEENAKRYAMGQSAKVGGVSYSMKAGSSEGEFSNMLKESERVRREIMANSQSMLIAETDRSEAVRREKAATTQSMMIAEVERAEARRREVLVNSQIIQMAEIDRAEAMRREKLAVSQALQIADIERAEAVKREKNSVSQQMLIAEIDRAEAKKIEVARIAREMQIAEIERAEQQKREKSATAQEMLIASIERAEQIKNEIIRNARDMQMAEIDRADAMRLQRQRTANEMMIAETKRAEEERQLIQNSRFQAATPQAKVTTLRSASALYGDGTDQRRVTLATNRYGSDAVGEIKNIAQYENAVATATRGSTQATLQNAAARREATAQNRAYNESLHEIHSGVRGLAGGLGQLWATWGSVIPLVAGAAVAGSMVKVFETGKEVEYQLQFLRALSSDLEKQPIDLGKFLTITDGTMATVKDAAGGMRALAQAGMNQKEAFAALPNILDLATIGEMSVGQAALTATGVVHAFGLELNEIGHVGDVFAKVAASSNTSVVAMTESMKSASTVGEMFHVSMEETAASIGVLAQRNITGTAAGTALTTALKNLYEPTSKAAAALKVMNIETDDGHGGLKNYTELLEELRVKLAGLNDSSKAVFLGTITDQRGAKALSAITSNIKEYKSFLDDARDSTGFMGKATLDLEDTVQGAMQRMSNTMEGTFLKAFQQASPTIREVITDMTGFAKSESTVELLTRLAVTAANLTKVFVEHAGAIGMAVAAYAGMKLISGAINGLVALRTSMALTTLTTEAATAAAAGNTVALTLEQQAALAAGRSLTVMGTAARFASAALGPIYIAVMLAVTAYELFHSKIESTDNAQKAANNTADTVLDYYQRQIDKLRELNNELTNFSKAGAQAAGDTAKAVVQAQYLNKSVEVHNLKMSGQGNAPASYTDQALVGSSAKTKLQVEEEKLKKLGDKLIDLDTKAKEMAAGQGLNKKLNDKKGVENRLEQLIRDAGGDEADPAGNAATKLMLPKILALKDTFKGSTEGYKEVAAKIVDYRKELNEKLGTFTAPHKDKGAGDAYRAAQSDLDGELQAIKDRESTKLADVKSKLATHEIGDLQAIASNMKIVKDAREEELDVLKRKKTLAESNDKKNDSQKIDNSIEKGQRASLEAENESGRKSNELTAKWATEDLRIEADKLRKRGELVRAFQAEFDAKNAPEIRSLESDIAAPNVSLLDSVKASRRVDSIQSQRSTGTDVATFDELQDKFDSMVNNMQEQLAQVAEKASQSNGFFSDVGAAQAGQDIRDKMIPAINEVVARMRGIAGPEGLNDKGLQSTVSKMSATMIKEADKSKVAWIAAGRSISQSLSDSFGKGGKAAGGIVEALIKQRAAQKDIDSDLAKSKKDDPTKALEAENKARQQSAELQISSYAEIAGAAKGFFTDHARGYAAMEAAEKVFRAFEMAEAVRSFLTKSGFLTAFTALFATSKATEVAAEAGSVAPTLAAEGAKQAAHGVTALAAALSLPFPANLPAFAVTAAMLAAIGVAVKGGSSGANVSAQRQKDQGAGSVLGDEKEKSESLSKALTHMSDSADIGLKYSAAMTSSLHNIESSLSSLGGMLIRNGSVTGKLPEGSNSISDFSRHAATAIDVVFGGLVGTAMDKLLGGNLGKFTGKLTSAVFGGKTSAEDTGFTLGKGTVASLLQGGVSASQYADIKTTGGWFRSDKHSTDLNSLGSEANDQFGKVIQSMVTGIASAGDALGNKGADFKQHLNSFVVDIGKVSLKDLKGEEIQKAIESVFSKLGDDMAKYAMPGLNDFQKVGEGYFETLVRVASGVDVADYSLEKLGITAVKYTDVLNKQGDVAAEIVRDSLMSKEAASGVGQIIKNLSGSVDDLVQTYTKLNDVRRTMRVIGMSNADVTTSMVRGAGGLDKLSSGISDYLDKFFSEGEKAAAKVSLLQDEFIRMGVSMPKSIQDFKTLVSSIDRTTDAGQTLYGALISVAGQFGDLADSTGNVNPAIAKQRAAIQDLVKSAQRWIDLSKSARNMVLDIDKALSKTGEVDQSARINELKAQLNSTTTGFEQQLEIAGELKDLVLEKYQTEKQNAKDLIQYGKDLNKYVTSLKTGDLSPLTNKQKLEEAQRDYSETLKNTQSSDKDIRDEARGSIQEKANTFLDLAHTYYTSSQSYKDIFASVTENLGNLGMSSIEQGKQTNDLNQQQVDELKNLKEVAKSIQSASDAEYHATLNQTATQMTALQSMADSLGILSGLPEILRDLPADLAADLAGKGVSGSGVNGTGTDQIEALYRSILHRASDTSGKQFWMDQYKNGMSIDQIKADFLKSDEYKSGLINGSHAKGLDYVPFDGYVAELHRGESVLTATEASARRTNKASMASTASFSSAEREEMAAEIRELRKTMERVIETSVQNTQALAGAMHAATGNAAEHVAQATKEAAASGDYDNRNKPAYQ